MTLEAAKEAANVASGTFLVNVLPTNILFDLRAKFSFVSHTFGGKLALHVEKLDDALIV